MQISRDPAKSPRLDQLFSDQVRHTPDQPAIFCQGRVLSYGDLHEAVDRFAQILALNGVGPGVLVAICLQRTPAMVAAVLGVLKAGGAYLPLDPGNPAERNRFILRDSGCALVLADSGARGLHGFGGLVLEPSGDTLIGRASGPGPRPTAPGDAAYVIYTSGSTGRPKGVTLEHGAIHLIAWAERFYSEEQRSRVAATTSLSFDPSVLEIFMPLCLGGALVLKPNALAPFSADEQPTLLNTVPSVLAELCRAAALPPSLRVLNVGGEVLTGALAAAAYRDRPDLVVDNHYGPTEATTVATVGRVPRHLVGEPSIGQPVRGAEILLLDPEGRQVADGDTGEIHIGGVGLALGYLNRPDLTRERFIDGPSGLLYRTGDLARRQGEDLRFAGRLDRQVKIRGVRVELGEVEQALRRIPQVEEAVVQVDAAETGSRLVAYVQSESALRPADARARLATWLPPAMLPARIVVLDRLPRLASGKLDPSRLREPKDPEVSDAPCRSIPLSRMERPIVHVFEEVLSRTGMGPDDNFFDLGGDSLASVRAALRLEELLGRELPPALIHQSPTARALAQSLDHARVNPERHVSLLQQGGDEPPVFCVADLFGQPFNYLSLARRLGGRRSIHGVSPGPLQAAFSSDRDVSRLTRGFMEEVLAIQPQGPCIVAGYSAGGMLALDLACALERQGREVWLILLDSTLCARPPSAAEFVNWVLGQGSAAAGGRRLAALTAALARGGASLARGLFRRRTPAWLPRSQVAFAASLIAAGLRYRPDRFGGPTLLVRAGRRDPTDLLFDRDGLMGWSAALSHPATMITVAGDHHSFLREPQVRRLAAVIEGFLGGAAARDQVCPARVNESNSR